MKVAICVPAAGSPGTLATTAFSASIADGLGLHDAPARLFCLALHANGWVPSALGDTDAVAPWLSALPKGRAAAAEALAAGVFDSTLPCTDGRLVNWQLELALQKGFEAWRGDDELLVIADTRAYKLLRLTARVCNRIGARIVVLSNEALTDIQIDASTRADYVRCVVECADAIWAVSENLRDYWIGLGFNAKRILLAPTAVRPSSLTRPVQPRRGHRAAYVGNLAHREIGRLLDVSAQVRTRIPDFTLALYGDASDADRAALQATIEDAGLAEAITAMPPVAVDRVPDVLDAADVVLLPRAAAVYSNAGFPNKLGEYLASGRPVVVTRVGDIGRYLEDGVSALLVDPDDMGGFADAVVRALESPDLGDAIGATGRRVAVDVLSAEHVAVQLLALAHVVPAPPTYRPKPPTAAARLAAMLPDPAVARRNLVRALRSLQSRGDATNGSAR